MNRNFSYVVASSPRTGSYLLCEGLETTGIAGRPTEVFSPEFQSLWCRRWGFNHEVDFETYFHAAILHGTSSNGVYGLKIHWMHVEKLAHQASFSDEYEDILDFLFPSSVYVHVTRQDRRAQALSYYRALLTNEWWHIDGVENDQRNGRTPFFDANSILALEGELARQDEAWKGYFRKRKLKPLVIEYEALSADYQAQVARVLSFLGLDPSVAYALPPPRLVRQADSLTSRWRDRLDSIHSPERKDDITPKHCHG